MKSPSKIKDRPNELEMPDHEADPIWRLGISGGQPASHRSHSFTDTLEHPLPPRHYPSPILTMANRGYDVVVDVDTEVGRLRKTHIMPISVLTTAFFCRKGRPGPYGPARRRPRVPFFKY